MFLLFLLLLLQRRQDKPHVHKANGVNKGLLQQVGRYLLSVLFLFIYFPLFILPVLLFPGLIVHFYQNRGQTVSGNSKLFHLQSIKPLKHLGCQSNSGAGQPEGRFHGDKAWEVKNVPKLSVNTT